MLSRLLLTAALLASPCAFADSFAWNVPEIVEETEVVGEVKVDGVPVRMHVVVSRWSIEKLVQHFATRFDEAGLYIAPKQNSPARQPILTGLDAKRGKSYSVIFEQGPGPHTTLVLGTASFRDQQRPVQKDFVPAFPGAQGLVRSEDEGARILSFQAKASAAEVREYYRTVLRGDGFKETSEDVFQKGDKEIALTLRPVATGKTHVLLYARAAIAPAELSTP